MTRKVTTITTENEPEGMDSFWVEVERVGRQKIPLTQKNGVVTEVTATHAILQKLAQSGLQGSPQSIRQANALHQEAARRRRHDTDMEVARWSHLKAAQIKRFATYTKEHGEDPLEFPHPDDIEIDPVYGVRLLGPLCIEAHNSLMHTKRFIYACLLQDALDNRADQEDKSDRREESSMLFLAHMLNDLLPPRMRLNDIEFIMETHRAGSATKRALLKQTRAAWQTLGYAVPRGWTSGPLERAETLAKTAIDITELSAHSDLSSRERTQRIATLIYEEFG